jgi:hypothetical protein
VTGSRSNGAALLDKAQRTLDTARTIAASDPNSAYTLAYDAARHAGTALLAQQGLRPTSRGGHYALERALKGQFGQGFRAFGTMRRRRNELEYPDLPDETASLDETQQPLNDAQALSSTDGGASSTAALGGCGQANEGRGLIASRR